jgi:hypothetical protein
MFPVLSIPQALSPGSTLILWQGRLPAKVVHPVPLIEILPENHGDVTLNFQQRKGTSLYNRQGQSALTVQKGFYIDRYC